MSLSHFDPTRTLQPLQQHVLVASPPPSLRRRDLHQEIHGDAHARGSRKIAMSDEQQVD
jgi:hypothetical protein